MQVEISRCDIGHILKVTGTADFYPSITLVFDDVVFKSSGTKLMHAKQLVCIVDDSVQKEVKAYWESIREDNAEELAEYKRLKAKYG